MLSIVPDSHPELFPYVLIEMALICGMCWVIGPLIVVPARKKAFTFEVMDRFTEEHQRNFDTKISSIGFPDTGNGKYAQELSYKDWFHFNNAMRVHYNFVEQLPSIMVLIFIASLKSPLPTLILAGLYFVFRFIYTIGYVVGGPNLRAIGAIPILVIKIVLLGYALYTCSCYMSQYSAAKV